MDNSKLSLTFLSTHPNLHTLPFELFESYLFPNLHLDDIWQLRLVNKKLNQTIKNYNIFELYFRPSYLCRGNWITTSRSIKLRIQLCDSKLDSFIKQPLSKFPSNLLILKRLKLDLSNRHFEIEDLNKFVNIKILEISNVNLNPLSNHQLNLPKLNALSLKGIKIDTSFLSIIAPNLDHLKFQSSFLSRDTSMIGNQIQFNYSTIRTLQIDNYENSLSIFTNLECLEFFHINDTSIDHLLEYRNLMQIKVIDRNFELNQLRRLVRLKQQRDLDVFYQGVRMNFDLIYVYENTYREFGDTDFPLANSRFVFQVRNYNYLEDNLDFVTEMDYRKDLIAEIPLGLQAVLFDKYTNIQHLRIRGLIVEKNLIQAIRNMNNLKSICIKGSPISQAFYDRLAFISNLFELKIRTVSKALNYSFITKMSYLKELDTDQDVPLNHNLDLNNLQHLEAFTFALDGLPVLIRKEAFDKYFIENYRQLIGHYFLDKDSSYDHSVYIIDTFDIRNSVNFKELVNIFDYFRNLPNDMLVV